MFYLLETANVETVVVDLSTLSSDVDLSQFKKIKIIFTYSQNARFTLVGNCPIIKLENCIDFESTASPLDFTRVYNFEEMANKQQVLTYCRTSGSTG